MMPDYIYHIVDAEAWAAAQAVGQYEHPSLAQEGFIHFSFAHQVEQTANRYFRAQPELYILQVAVDLLPLPVQVEAAPSGELFPHVYAPLPLSAVVTGFVEPRQPDGHYRLSRDLKATR